MSSPAEDQADEPLGHSSDSLANAKDLGDCDEDPPATAHVCRVCDAKFEIRADLLKHYKGHERDKKSMTCSICDCSFHSTVELLIHRKKHDKSNGNRSRGSTSGSAKEAANSVVRRRRNR